MPNNCHQLPALGHNGRVFSLDSSINIFSKPPATPPVNWEPENFLFSHFPLLLSAEHSIEETKSKLVYLIQHYLYKAFYIYSRPSFDFLLLCECVCVCVGTKGLILNIGSLCVLMMMADMNPRPPKKGPPFDNTKRFLIIEMMSRLCVCVATQVFPTLLWLISSVWLVRGT